MKKISIMLALLITGALAFQSCEDLDDNDIPVQDFIWKGLNLYYLWKDQVPNLNDDRFANQAELNAFIQDYSSPEALFESLLLNRGVTDRFSVLVPDYLVLENALQGIVKSNGAEYGLRYVPGSDTDIFGYVRYILPNSDAASKDIQRGDIFYAVNGTPLTVSNYSSLLNADTYTLNLADFNGGDLTPTGESVMLSKSEYAENPVYNVSVINEGTHVIGYLMYNGFFSNYNAELNAAFGQLAAQNVNQLVLDLRYNSGGSVRTATYLASMITGQFDGELFSKQQWNSTIQAYYEANNPESLNELFATQLANGTPINSLGLQRVYILTSAATASASELIINCLKPYINVVVIGDTTVGKNVGSITLYDSPDFTRNNVESSHRYAMQPIVIRTLNANGFANYNQGILPTPGLELVEDMSNLGQIGSPSEPLLAAAINRITGMGRRVSSPAVDTRGFRDSKNTQRFGTEMYLENVPHDAYRLIKELQ